MNTRKKITRPLPAITLDTEEFWKSTKAHEAKLQKCNNCGKFWYYPGPLCHYCGSRDFTWTPITGKGSIWTYSLLERAKGNPYEDDVPIAIIIVQLDDGPMMMSNLFDYEDEELAIGTRVTIDYEDVDDEVTLIVFTPDRG